MAPWGMAERCTAELRGGGGNICMHRYVCVYVYVYVYVYMQMYMCVCLYTYTYT